MVPFRHNKLTVLKRIPNTAIYSKVHGKLSVSSNGFVLIANSSDTFVLEGKTEELNGFIGRDMYVFGKMKVPNPVNVDNKKIKYNIEVTLYSASNLEI